MDPNAYYDSSQFEHEEHEFEPGVSEAVSETILIPSFQMLQTIKEVAEEMFATTQSHFLNIKDKKVESSINKLRRLGISDHQIANLINKELALMNKNNIVQNMPEKRSKNLVQIQPNTYTNKKNPRAKKVRW